LVSEENCKQLVAQLEKKEKKLDILFNNAGATWGGIFIFIIYFSVSLKSKIILF